MAIGDPFSRGFSMTSGIISAVGRTINPTDSNFSVPRVIQHDAATNPGNSGGPLLNRYGEVIGINTQIISQTGAFSGIGLAVPINLARLVAPALIEDGRYEYPYIGIRGTTLGPDMASAMGLPDDTRGALVLAVSADSAAQRPACSRRTKPRWSTGWNCRLVVTSSWPSIESQSRGWTT